MFNIFKKKQEFKSTSDQTEEKSLLIHKIIDEIFPTSPYVLNGYWSFCSSKLDLVFPEITLYSETFQREFATGVIIHCIDLRDKDALTSLSLKCDELKLTLVLVSDLVDVDIDVLKERIFSSIEKNILSALGSS